MKVLVRIVFGLDPNDWRGHHDEVIAFLDATATKDKAVAGRYEYKKDGREYDISVTYTRADFKAALDTDDAIVVYAGHSRFGQGPAFGTSDADTPECPDAATYPANPWEGHFRMGYDAVDVPCIEDIYTHCTNPAEFTKTDLPRDLFVHDDVRQVVKSAKGRSTRCDLKGYARRSLLTCFPKTADLTNGRGVKTLKTRHYWYTRKRDTEFHTIVDAGSADLSGVSLRCGVLLMYSCTSKHHYYEALKRRRKAAKSKCVLYLTTVVPRGVPATKRFVQLVLKGIDPRTRRGSEKFLREMGRIRHSGRIVKRP